MYSNRLYKCFLMAALAFACALGPASALNIQPNYGAFQGDELKVLQDAVKEWADLLPCTDGKTIPVSFVCDINLSILGSTNTIFDQNGNVVSATVTLDNDGLYWTLTDPANWPAGHEDDVDALLVAKHEVGHAIGFIDGGKFMNKVKVVNGNRFYDMNGDGVYNDNDFDLEDTPTGWEGHAASSSALMNGGMPPATRKHPSMHEAQVLGDAYGYCVTPEPGSLLTLMCGCVGIVGLKRRRA